MQEHSEDIHSIPRPQCPHCRADLSAGDLVCPNCGYKLKPEERVSVGPEAPDRN
jgi:predicted amidophosphoribosyltransferase